MGGDGAAGGAGDVVSGAPPGAERGPGRRLPIGLLVAALAALPFLPALGFGFVYDDEIQILDNTAAHSWDGLRVAFVEHLWSFDPQHPTREYYRPLFASYLTLGWQLFGPRPLPWHLASVLLHALVAGLLWRLGGALGLSRTARGVGLAVFVCHASHAEPVAWVSAFSDPLTAALQLGALLLWIGHRRRRSRPRAAAAVVLLAASLLVMERAIAGVAVLVCLDLLWPWDGARLPGAARLRGTLTRAAPLLGVLAAWIGLRWVVLGTPATRVGEVGGAELLGAWPRVLAAYLDRLLWPQQSGLASPVGPGADGAAVGLAVLALVAAGAVIVALSRRGARRWLALAGMLWLAPALALGALPPDGWVQDRYLYLPSAAWALWLGAVVVDGVGALRRRRRLVLAAVAVYALVSLVALQRNLRPWHDDRALYERAFAMAPDSGKWARNVGVVRQRAGDFEGAAVWFAHAAEVEPDYTPAHYSLALALEATGKPAEAVASLDRCVEQDPTVPVFYFHRGRLLHRLGRAGEGCADLDRARRLGQAQGWVGRLVSLDDVEAALARDCAAGPPPAGLDVARPDDPCSLCVEARELTEEEQARCAQCGR